MSRQLAKAAARGEQGQTIGPFAFAAAPLDELRKSLAKLDKSPGLLDLHLVLVSFQDQSRPPVCVLVGASVAFVKPS